MGHDAAFLADLIGTFLAESPAQLASLQAAVERGDAAEARRVAHTLKSNAATFGVVELERVCRELEGHAKDGKVAEAAPLVPAVEQALAEARAPLESLASPEAG